MIKKNQDRIFYKSEGDKYFKRNGPRINKSIFKAVKFLQPNPNSNVFEIGCGCGSTLKKIENKFKTNVYGLDASGAIVPFSQPGIVTIPLGFVALVVVSLFTQPRTKTA